MSGYAAQLDRPAVRRDDAPGDAEAEPRAAMFAGARLVNAAET
jgi:hypothetical protein